MKSQEEYNVSFGLPLLIVVTIMLIISLFFGEAKAMTFQEYATELHTWANVEMSFSYDKNTEAVKAYNKVNGTKYHTIWEMYSSGAVISSQGASNEVASVSNIEGNDNIAIQLVNIKADSVKSVNMLEKGDTLIHKSNYFINKRTNMPIAYHQAPDSLVQTIMDIDSEVHIYTDSIPTSTSSYKEDRSAKKAVKVKYVKRKKVLKHYSCGNRRNLINKIGIGIIKYTPLGWGLGIMPWTDLSKKFNQ
jgi:hypothetical protein